MSKYLRDALEVKIKVLQLQCPRLFHRGYHYPTKGGDGGDDCLWLGLLSTVGLWDAHSGMWDSQQHIDKKHPRYGMFYRNPKRRDTDNKGYKYYFSRDMALGVLAWFVSMKARNPSLKTPSPAPLWLDYIENRSRNCLVKKPSVKIFGKTYGGGCLIRDVHRFAPDDRSIITPTMWALLGKVWEFIELKPSKEMRLYEGADGDSVIAGVILAEAGYQVHLAAVQSYLKFLMKKNMTYARTLGEACLKKVPQNLFYRFLAKQYVDEEDIEELISLIPDPKDFTPRDYWLWEKGDYVDAIAEKKFCGWDLVFLGKLFLEVYR